MDFRTDPLRIFAAHEVATLADVSMATKVGFRPPRWAGLRQSLGRCHVAAHAALSHKVRNLRICLVAGVWPSFRR